MRRCGNVTEQVSPCAMLRLMMPMYGARWLAVKVSETVPGWVWEGLLFVFVVAVASEAAGGMNWPPGETESDRPR